MDGWSGMGGRVGRQAVAWIGLSRWMDKQMELGGGVGNRGGRVVSQVAAGRQTRCVCPDGHVDGVGG